MIPINNIDAPPLYSARVGPFWALIVAVGFSLLLIEHHIPHYPWSEWSPLGQADDDQQLAENMEVVANDGNWGNRCGWMILGVLGAYLLLRRGPRPWNLQGLLPPLVLFVVAWCLASMIWADDAERAARRLASLLLCLVGALGLAKQLSGRELCLLLLIVTAGYALLGAGIEAFYGAFHPWAAWYRFAGTLHPNGQAVNCAVLCLSAAILAAGGASRRRLFLAASCAGALLLLATKSRTNCLALAPALVLVLSLKPSARWAFPFSVVTWLAGAVLLVALLLGVNVPELLGASLEMGRVEDTGTLSGRTELWAQLNGYFQRRQSLGYGYGGFWTAERVQAISSTQSWGISSAHSSYFEALLSVGVIGAAALALVVIAGLWRAAVQYRATGDSGAAFLFAMLIFSAVHGISESEPVLPRFILLVTACALFRLTFFRPKPAPRVGKEAHQRERGFHGQSLGPPNQRAALEGEPRI